MRGSRGVLQTNDFTMDFGIQGMSTRESKAAMYVLKKPVTTCMDRNVLVLDKDTSTRAAAKQLQEHTHDDILVTHKGECVGIVTEKDIFDKVSDVSINAETTTLQDIMSTPVVSIDGGESLQAALGVMKSRHHNKLPVTNRRGKVVGMIYRTEILDRARWAASRATPREMSPPAKAILGNLGFVLQFAGILLLAPALMSTFMGDTVTATGIYLSLVLLLTTGFFLNSYGEKARMNLRQASVVVFSSLFLLSLFGTIPYLYVPPGLEQADGEGVVAVPFAAMRAGSDSGFEMFASAFFSSAAGYTTGGISLYDTPQDLPQSFTFYRSYTQMLGGMSFIYLVITAFYPNSKLEGMRGFITGRELHMRELFGTIAIIFSLYVVIVAMLLYILGDNNLLDDISLAMSTLATGGFVPHSEMVQDMGWAKHLVLMAAMILGAMPFAFHYGMVGTRGRKSHMGVGGRPPVGRELLAFFVILIGAMLLLAWVGGLGVVDSIFYTISAGTTAGLQSAPLDSLTPYGQQILMTLMLVGGCGFSTAGGIKVFRMLNLANACRMILPKTRAKISREARRDIRDTILIIAAFPAIAALCGIYLVDVEGANPDTAFLDAVGVITTGGLSTGVVDFDTSAHTKILLSMLMIFGRLEIIAIVYALAPRLLDRN